MQTINNLIPEAYRLRGLRRCEGEGLGGRLAGAGGGGRSAGRGRPRHELLLAAGGEADGLQSGRLNER